MRSTITLLFGFILSYHVNACDCKEFLDNEKIEQADFIADILILKNYDSENDHQQYKADIKINKLYKGNSIESIFIHGVNGNTKNLSTCSIFIPEGTRLIAYSKKTNDKYSIAEIATWSWIARHKRHDIGLNNFENLSRWFVEIAERPAVVKGFKALNKDAEIDFP